MKYFSMFTGIGGFEKGIEQAYGIRNHEHALVGEESEPQERAQRGQRAADKQGLLLHDRDWAAPLCVGYSEIDKYAIQTYERHYEHTNYGSATNIYATDLPDFDLLVGGFPCQAFSIAGKRLGFGETRGTLFFDIARILQAKRPRHLVLENVKGLLSHEQGKTFQTILGVLTDLGYRVEWQVLNSKDFGVPQNRERVYIVGHLGDGCGREIFPLTGTDGKDTRIVGQDVAYTIDANYHKGTNTLEKGRRSVVEITGNVQQSARVYDEHGVSPTLNTMQGGQKQPKIVAQRGRYNVDGITEQQLEPRKDNLTNTLTAVQKDNMLLETTRIRRLTPTECERLQGFPDGWTAGVSDTQRYKQCGNAVTVNVVEAVISGLIPCLEV